MGQDDWHLYYSKPVTFEAAMGAWIYHWPYLLQVRRKTRVSALEIGCGRGVHSTFLSYSVPKVVGIDNSAELVIEARRQNSILHGRAKFVHCDAFDMDFPKGLFDVCFSQGFLEHFSDEDIRLLIEKQLSFAETVVASVPSCYYPTRDKGDERLMAMEDWRRVLSNYRTRIFYYGFEPKEPGKTIALKNFGDLGKIVMSKFFRLHLCIVAEKANSLYRVRCRKN
jgi:SAM-dependent methyltransferase